MSAKYIMRSSLLACAAALVGAVSARDGAAQEGITKSALQSQAFWIDRATILVPTAQALPDAVYKLYGDPDAKIAASKTGILGKYSVALHPAGTLTAQQLARFPQLAHGYTVLALPSTMTERVEHLLLQGQLVVAVLKPNATVAYFTGVQTAGVLDDLYAYNGSLGVVLRNANADAAAPADAEWNDFPDAADGVLKVKLWAPTAQSVGLQLFLAPNQTVPSETVPMREHNGVWVAVLDKLWIGHYYLFEEKVYAPVKLAVVQNVVTDPYSIDITTNGTKSRLLNINDPATKPEGWDGDASPALPRWNDLSIYELHVRDFSVADATVPAEHRGMYLAFTDSGSDGMKHLQALASAGLKAVHLLPTFHSASVDEDKSNWKTTGDLSHDPPDGEQQQAAVNAVREGDAYNWGYDPLHYLTPAGNYAVHPQDRVREYRSMVVALHHTGLRVIQDVVFNHTSGFGLQPTSVLDKVVPNYYNRLDANGDLLTATCCADTASEHVMMGKLQQDAILWNAKHYKIDGFRFDLMDFTFVDNLRRLRTALDQLTPAKDGVDGTKIYIYGEGWDFGETEHNALGRNATQLNLFGVGVGTFNDRIRDGVRGGTVTADLRPQGFATGLVTDPSQYAKANFSRSDDQKALRHDEDLVTIGLAGNLRDYRFTNSSGVSVTGAQVDYGGKPAGYAASPTETINYVSAHDNQALFDAIQIKSSLADDAATRARRQVMAMSIVALGQGIPFFTGGDDMLRSKDMDRNSYNSGDWFNQIDWSERGNNWAIGLPLAGENNGDWMTEKPLLRKAELTPSPGDIQRTTAAFQDFLKIRYSSGLFRMGSLEEVQEHLHFLESKVPGLIVMLLDSKDSSYGTYRHVLVVFNATNASQTVVAEALRGISLQLHPVQMQSADAAVRSSTFAATTGSVTVSALTTAVFVGAE